MQRASKIRQRPDSEATVWVWWVVGMIVLLVVSSCVNYQRPQLADPRTAQRAIAAAEVWRMMGVGL